MRNREALSHVDGQQAGMRYAWVFNGNGGYEITGAKILGWSVVQGDDPEAMGHKDLIRPDGIRQNGDVTLMRIDQERYEEIRDYEYELYKRASGDEMEEELDELIKSKGGANGKFAKPVGFTTREELKELIEKRGRK